MNMLNLPKKIYFKKGSMAVALKELDEVYNCKRAFIISDANLYTQGVVAPVNDFLRGRGIRTAEFFTLSAVPTFEDVRSGLPKMLEYEPDAIVAVGGGSVMSAAKAMWLLYENPELDLEATAKKFNSTSASYADFPEVGNKAKLFIVATNASTGAEASPFAVLADDAGKKHVIASYKLLPEISVTDSDFTNDMPADLVKKSGLTVLTQAARAYTAAGHCEYTQGFAREAAEIVLDKLEAAVKGCPAAREKLAHAAIIASMAFSNAAETIDTEAGIYPNAQEKSAKNENIDDLAKHVGLNSAADFIAACEKLASL